MTSSKGRFADLSYQLKRDIDITKKVIKVLLFTNAMSFSTVAMEKAAGFYDAKQAAAVNAMSAVPILYDLGYTVGHRIFYDDKNFMKTAESQIGFKNSIPRPYLEFKY